MQKIFAGLITVLGLFVFCTACGNSADGLNDTDGGTDSDSNTDTISDSNTDTISDSDPDTNSDSDPDTNSDSDPDTNSDSDPDTNSDSDPDNVYEPGTFDVEVVQIKAEEGKAPRPVRISLPTENGTYPMVLFFHGFLCVTSWYDTITAHLASHGYIVAAIQTIDRGNGLPIGKPSIATETQRAEDTISWLKDNIDDLIEAKADLTKIGFAGHSRGGKIAWNVVQTAPDHMPDAIAGIDPVDNTVFDQTTVIKGPLTYNMPSLAIGTGLGSVPKMGVACAPENGGHLHFWENLPSPAYHVVAEEFGHMEMLDAGINCGTTCSSCTASKNGDRVAFRQQIGGSLVAFFEGALRGKEDYYQTLTDTQTAPVLVTSQTK